MSNSSRDPPVPLTSTVRPGMGCSPVRNDELLWSGGISPWVFSFIQCPTTLSGNL